MVADDAQERETRTLPELLERVHEVAESEQDVTVAMIMDRIGERSFGTVLLLAGVVILMPLIGDIPGVPTTMAVVVLLTAGQMLLRRRAIWLPRWLLSRSVSGSRLRKATTRLKKPARFVDRLLRRRLQVLVRGPAASGIGLACLLIGLALPPMELIPFSANLAGAALLGFGLAVISRDGLVALISFTFTAAVAGLVIWQV
jgi:hypothetical protein